MKRRAAYKKRCFKSKNCKKMYLKGVHWRWGKTIKKNGKMYRVRVQYAFKGKKWVPTGKKYWPRVQWRWRKVTKIKKGLLYRLRKMYVYSRTAKKWFRTRRSSWRRIKRKEGSTGWMWVGAPKKHGRNGKMYRQRVLVVWKGKKWVPTGKKYWRCVDKKCRRRQR